MTSVHPASQVLSTPPERDLTGPEIHAQLVGHKLKVLSPEQGEEVYTYWASNHTLKLGNAPSLAIQALKEGIANFEGKEPPELRQQVAEVIAKLDGFTHLSAVA